MTTEQLNPCAHCGAQPQLKDLAGWEIHCDCGISMCLWGPEKEPLIAAWNRRAPVELSAQTEQPVAWYDAAVGGFYLSYESIPPNILKSHPITPLGPIATHPAKTEQPSLSDAEIVITLAEHGIGLMSHTSDVEPFPLDGDDAPIFIAAYRALLAQPQDRKYEERFRWIEENCHTEGGGKGFTIFVPVDHEDIGCGIDIAIANGAPK